MEMERVHTTKIFRNDFSTSIREESAGEQKKVGQNEDMAQKQRLGMTQRQQLITELAEGCYRRPYSPKGFEGDKNDHLTQQDWRRSGPNP